jgi:signal transduction histidine kinase
MFQPISEAKSVLLMLAPFLLLLDILLGLIVAYIYLRREEQYAQNKTDFMRAAHHELKTPIAALSGIVEGMIDNVGVYKNRDEYLGRAKEIIERLNLLTNDVLKATQSMSRKITKEPVEVGELFAEVMEQHKYLLEGKPLHFQSFRFQCQTNRMLLGNAFSNLVSNAARYSAGEINISFAHNTLSICNECAPIGEEDLQRIFEPFYTPSHSRDRSQSGNGIGLYIVKRNLDALKHKFAMRNTEKGVVFEIFF